MAHYGMLADPNYRFPDRYQQSVVPIFLNQPKEQENGLPIHRDGVGCFVYDSDHTKAIWLLTALHVVFDIEQADRRRLPARSNTVWFGYNGKISSLDISNANAAAPREGWIDCVAFKVENQNFRCIDLPRNDQRPIAQSLVCMCNYRLKWKPDKPECYLRFGIADGSSAFSSDIHSEKGDSGSPIFWFNSERNWIFAGIHSGRVGEVCQVSNRAWCKILFCREEV